MENIGSNNNNVVYFIIRFMPFGRHNKNPISEEMVIAHHIDRKKEVSDLLLNGFE